MRRVLRAHVFIGEDSMRTLERVRRGTRQPLSRFLAAIVHEAATPIVRARVPATARTPEHRLILGAVRCLEEQ